MFKLFKDIKGLEKEWDQNVNSIFLESTFLDIFHKTHKDISHFFFLGKGFIMYSSIFTLSFTKVNNYITNNFVIRFILNFLKLDVFYFGSPFITNVPYFNIRNYSNFSLNDIMIQIRDNYHLIVIPDFLYNNFNTDLNKYIKLEVESDMVLEIREEWTNIDNYIQSLKTKYRKKVKVIFSKTKDIVVKRLNSSDLEKYNIKLNNLFNQVIRDSRFHGPKFNIDCLRLLLENNFISLYGYFLEGEMIGFSSEIDNGDVLYSYYVGFDKQYNIESPIYGRILLEMISHAIEFNKRQIIFGRTANEYKSNFGAEPVESHVYIGVRNPYFFPFFKFIFSRVKVSKWVKRRSLKASF